MSVGVIATTQSLSPTSFSPSLSPSHRQPAKTYRVYGVLLRVNCPVPLLTAVEVPLGQPQADCLADIQVHLQETERALVVEPIGEAIAPGLGWRTEQRAAGRYYCLRSRSESEALQVEISPSGERIEIAYWGMPLSEVAALLVGCVLGTAMRLRGLVCLHSSVVAIDGEAIALIGNKGAGKSTTAAMLAQQGYSVLADDIAVINQVEDRFYVQPGYPRLRLWSSALDLLQEPTAGLERVFRPMDKHFVAIGGEGHWRFERMALPLKQVIVLGERCEGLTRQEKLPVVESLRQLLMYRYPQWLQLESSYQQKDIALLGQLAVNVVTTRVRMSDTLDVS